MNIYSTKAQRESDVSCGIIRNTALYVLFGGRSCPNGQCPWHAVHMYTYRLVSQWHAWVTDNIGEVIERAWDKHVENIVAKAGKRVYMQYQLNISGTGQDDFVTIYVSVSYIGPVLEYAWPLWHTNLNRHLTESFETVQKRALKCIYPGNEYADILCLTNLQCLKERRDSLCKKYFQKRMETTHRLNYLLPC